LRRAAAILSLVRSAIICRSNSAYCGSPQSAHYAERAIMQSHSAQVAVWPAYQ
jgi:hypothetical protein